MLYMWKRGEVKLSVFLFFTHPPEEKKQHTHLSGEVTVIFSTVREAYHSGRKRKECKDRFVFT